MPERLRSEDPTISGCEPPVPPIDQPQPISRPSGKNPQPGDPDYVPPMTLLIK